MKLSEKQEKKLKKRLLKYAFSLTEKAENRIVEGVLRCINEVLNEPEKKWEKWVYKFTSYRISSESGIHIADAALEVYMNKIVDIHNLMPLMLNWFRIIRNAKDDNGMPFSDGIDPIIQQLEGLGVT